MYVVVFATSFEFFLRNSSADSIILGAIAFTIAGKTSKCSSKKLLLFLPYVLKTFCGSFVILL